MKKILVSGQTTTISIPPSIRLENTDCPLGCVASDEPVVRGHDLLHGLPGEFAVVRCRVCGLQRTSPRPSPGSIGLYYPDEYGPYKGTRVVKREGAEDDPQSRLLHFAKRIFDTKTHALPDMRPGRMLEIGCASGNFMHQMAQRGWQVEGIEYHETAAQLARALGYNVETGALEKVVRPADSYDLIVGWMVVEHLHQPVQSLRKLAFWARHDARLVLSVPDAGAKVAQFFGKNWHDYHLPNHLFHYDTNTISKVLAQGGWRLVKLQHHRSLINIVASIGYWLREHGFVRLGQKFVQFPETGGRLGALLTFPLALPLAWIGQTGRMTIWAEIQ